MPCGAQEQAETLSTGAYHSCLMRHFVVFSKYWLFAQCDGLGNWSQYRSWTDTVQTFTSVILSLYSCRYTPRIISQRKILNCNSIILKHLSEVYSKHFWHKVSIHLLKYNYWGPMRLIWCLVGTATSSTENRYATTVKPASIGRQAWR